MRLLVPPSPRYPLDLLICVRLTLDSRLRARLCALVSFALPAPDSISIIVLVLHISTRFFFFRSNFLVYRERRASSTPIPSYLLSSPFHHHSIHILGMFSLAPRCTRLSPVFDLRVANPFYLYTSLLKYVGFRAFEVVCNDIKLSLDLLIGLPSMAPLFQSCCAIFLCFSFTSSSRTHATPCQPSCSLHIVFLSATLVTVNTLCRCTTYLGPFAPLVSLQFYASALSSPFWHSLLLS